MSDDEEGDIAEGPSEAEESEIDEANEAAPLPPPSPPSPPPPPEVKKAAGSEWLEVLINTRNGRLQPLSRQCASWPQPC